MRACIAPLAVSLFVVIASPLLVSAQEPDAGYDAPPHISLLDGEVELVRDGRREAAPIGHLLEAGDRIDTREGRAEILFGDGSALHIDRRTTIDMLDDGLLRLMTGRTYLHVADGRDRFQYRIDTPAASVYTDMPGEYRLLVEDGGEPTLELAVARGIASATTPRDSVAVRAGQMIRVRAGERPGQLLTFNAAYWDDFGRWSYERRYGRADVDAGGLPAPLTTYAPTFASYGQWGRHPSYGRVWYPRVARDWRPFYHGSWRPVAPYGWTWAGADPWAWPTHHYGTWGVSSVGAWFWIPGSSWWPAPVHWTITAGYVGWVPWGYGSVGVHGFTVIPRAVFSANVFVPRHVVHVHSVRPVVHNAFVAKPPAVPYVASARPAFAVPRGLVPVRVAVPRNGSLPAANGDRRAAARTVIAGSGQTESSAGELRGQRTAVSRSPARSHSSSVVDGLVTPGQQAERRAVSRFPERPAITTPPNAVAAPPMPAVANVDRSPAYRSRTMRGSDAWPRAIAVDPAPAPSPSPQAFEPRRRAPGDGGSRGRSDPAAAVEAPRAVAVDAKQGGARQAIPRSESGDRSDGGSGGGRSGDGGGRRRHP